MSALNLRLPESLHRQLRELAERDQVSINQFVVLAVAEKIAAMRTLDYIEQRGQRGSRELTESCRRSPRPGGSRTRLISYRKKPAQNQNRDGHEDGKDGVNPCPLGYRAVLSPIATPYGAATHNIHK